MSEEGDRPFVTRSGRVLTDADFQELADEAERGYEPVEIEVNTSYRHLVKKYGKDNVDGAIGKLMKRMEAQGG